MILDKLENVNLYQGLSVRLDKGFEYLKNNDLKPIKPGSYDISEGVRAIISEYNTKEEAEAKPEAHKEYIDIQFMITGEEQIGYAPLADQTPSVSYDAKKDLVFYNADTSLTKLAEGMFAIYFPTDIHQPGVKTGSTPTPVKKCVIKVLV